MGSLFLFDLIHYCSTTANLKPSRFPTAKVVNFRDMAKLSRHYFRVVNVI